MCLGRNLGQKALKKFRAKGKNGYIRVWKAVKVDRKNYTGLIFTKAYKGGLAKANIGSFREDQLIHAFRNKSSARYWSNIVVECLVKPKWVLAVGNAWPELTLTTKAIVMPKYPATKVTVREFRKAIKGKKVKKYSWE
jgi:hypothetical protein